MRSRTRSRSRRTGVLLLVAGVVLLATPVVAAAQTTDGSSDSASIGFYDVTAEATGIGGSMGDPSAQPYPVAAGLVPNSVAQLSAGPSGHALSTIAWPGPLGGNAGSLANVVGTPLPPELVSNANDPVKAEAQATGGARDEKTVGPMSALVDGDRVESKTALADFAAPSLISAARVVTKSRSYVDGSSVVAIAESELQGVEIAGQLSIDSIRTIAKGTTDGTTASTEPTVIVSGVSLAGQKGSLDDKGFHAGGGDQPSPLDPLAAAANDALSGMKMTAYVTKPLEQKTAAGSASLSTGSVIVKWEVGGGQVIVAVLGGASVKLTATTGSSLGLTDLNDLSASPAAPTPGLPTAVSPQAPGLVPSGNTEPGAVQSLSPGAPANLTAPRSGGSPSAIDLAFSPIGAFTDRVPGGWMIIGVLGMALLGSGLHKLRLAAVEAGATGHRCPLEGVNR